MVDRRFFPLLPFALLMVGIGCMVLLAFLTYQNIPTEGVYKLIIEGDYSEETLRTQFPILQKEELIGLSRQWVYINAMGSIEAIPLEHYYDRISPEDPRYDRYVERLWSLFVIPPTEGVGPGRVFYLRTSQIEHIKREILKEQKQIQIVRLGGSSTSPWFWWISQLIGLGATLWFIIHLRLPYPFFFLLPSFVFLSRLGTEGLVGSMALLSLLTSGYTPLEELFSRRTSYRQVFHWFRTELRRAFYALLLYGGVMVCALSSWYWFLLALLSALLFVISLFMLRSYFQKRPGAFFSPIPIVFDNRLAEQWRKALVVYAIGIPLLLLSEVLIIPQTRFEELGEDIRALKEEYQAYIEKQATFMFTSLVDPDRDYQVFEKNRDGFAIRRESLVPDISEWQHLELPPLESFFSQVPRINGKDVTSSLKIPVLLLSLFWYSVIIHGDTRWVTKRRKKIALYEKRIAA